jgi:hypothetical protein
MDFGRLRSCKYGVSYNMVLKEQARATSILIPSFSFSFSFSLSLGVLSVEEDSFAGVVETSTSVAIFEASLFRGGIVDGVNYVTC